MSGRHARNASRDDNEHRGRSNSRGQSRGPHPRERSQSRGRHPPRRPNTHQPRWEEVLRGDIRKTVPPQLVETFFNEKLPDIVQRWVEKTVHNNSQLAPHQEELRLFCRGCTILAWCHEAVDSIRYQNEWEGDNSPYLRAFVASLSEVVFGENNRDLLTFDIGSFVKKLCSYRQGMPESIFRKANSTLARIGMTMPPECLLRFKTQLEAAFPPRGAPNAMDQVTQLLVTTAVANAEQIKQLQNVLSQVLANNTLHVEDAEEVQRPPHNAWEQPSAHAP